MKLSAHEIQRAFSIDELRVAFPPILDTPGVAKLLSLSRQTIYAWIRQGRLDGAFRKRGKHLLFWRDRVLELIFNGGEW